MRAAALLALMTLGCGVRSFELPAAAGEEDGGTWRPGDAGFTVGTDGRLPGPGPDGPARDGGPDPGPGAGCGADLRSDPANCGRCGRVCSFASATPLCAAGQCEMGDCLPGFRDLDNAPENGCEYACTPTNDGKEICDDRDNDCNGKVDETTDKQNDVNNCGTCGNRCAFLHAAARCEAGKCVLAACDGQWRNANGLDADGCECEITNGGVEVCDGLDNDCNGKVDDVPASSFQDDPQHCGACNRNCTALPHAVGACQASACVIVACEFGHRDADRRVDNGCELACPGGFEGGVEVCDGVDNDCDGKVDAEDDSLLPVANFCEQRGACAGSVPRCRQGRWICDYGPDVQTVGPNQIIGDETWCDGKDNDCDGCIDEPFPQVAQGPSAGGDGCAVRAAEECTDKGVGACQGRGRYTCTADKMGVTCAITTPAAMPSPEVCDGKDNDCDGIVDNSDPADPARIKDPMVAISGGGLAGTVYMFAYEASRPDASATSGGRLAGRACARPGVLPWTNVTYPEAVAACKAAGKRLCTEAEWQRACETAAQPACTWSFAAMCTVESTQTCNTHEHDGDPMAAGDQDALLPTGALPACHAAWGPDKIFDLTGNAKEWTQARAPGKNPVRGGAFDTLLGGSSCRFDFVVLDDQFRFGNTGFRCCADAP